MLRRIPFNCLSKVCDCIVFPVRYSALFINGAKATENFTYVTPYIDFPEKLKQKDIIQENLIRRRSPIAFDKVENLWNVYEELKQRKLEYDKKKEEISKELGKLIKSQPDSDVTKKLKIQINLMKDNIKKLKVPLWSAEEAAVVEVLRLPNNLHPLTLESKNTIIFTHLTPPKNQKNHMNIGQKLDLLNFKKNENYYLKGDAAVFELGAKFYFNSILKINNFTQFSNPDFVKSLIVEGCGGDHTNPGSTFILHHNEDSKVNIDNRLHLTGGASLCSFLAYHAKNILYPKILPLKYYTMGRQYIPASSDENSLFHVSQSSVVQFFGVTKNETELDTTLHEIIKILKMAYCQLGYHFRLNIVSAEKIHMWESLRVAIEMYSTSMNSYVEVANISVSGEFISKRLMLTYVENKQSKFPHLLSGTILNVPKFLACVLEQDCNFTVPDSFQVKNWAL